MLFPRSSQPITPAHPSESGKSGFPFESEHDGATLIGLSKRTQCPVLPRLTLQFLHLQGVMQVAQNILKFRKILQRDF